MVDVNGVPQGQTPNNQPDPSVGGGQSGTPDWKSDPRFVGDPDKVWQSLKALESKMGEHSDELGTLRKTKAEYDAFYSTLVQTPDGRIIDRASYEKEQAAGASHNVNNAPSQPTEAEIGEKLAELQSRDPVAYFQTMKELAKREIRTESAERDKVFSNPIASQNQRVRQTADELITQGYPAAQALEIAVGREAIMVAGGGGNPNNAPPVIPNVLANQNRGNSSFMQPGGTIPPSTPEAKSNLTPEQEAMGRRLGFSAKDLEPFAGRG